MVKLVSVSRPSGGNASSSVGEKSTEISTSRVLSNWLFAYNQYTAESESPEQFHLWTGLSVLSSALKRNVWINQGIYLLFPNMFVILVGPPGKVAKSTTIRLGRKLLLGLEDIMFGPDSVTREELIHVMSKAGLNRTQSALTIHSTEMSSLIEPSGIKMIQFLTDIYDGDFKWQHSTKHSGRDIIENPVLNILAGTTPSWIAEGLPSDVLGHGFTARVIFVYGSEPRYLMPFPREPNSELVKDLINDLDHISRIEGSFTWGDGSRDIYSDMYTKLATSIPDDYRIEGFHNRKKVHLLKVAMLLSISESDDLILRKVDLETAWDILNLVEKDMGKTFSAVGKYDHANDLERILLRIRKEGGMTAESVHKEFYAMGDIQEIGKILLMLLQMGSIVRRDENGITWYRPA